MRFYLVIANEVKQSIVKHKEAFTMTQSKVMDWNLILGIPYKILSQKQGV